MPGRAVPLNALTTKTYPSQDGPDKTGVLQVQTQCAMGSARRNRGTGTQTHGDIYILHVTDAKVIVIQGRVHEPA